MRVGTLYFLSLLDVGFQLRFRRGTSIIKFVSSYNVTDFKGAFDRQRNEFWDKPGVPFVILKGNFRKDVYIAYPWVTTSKTSVTSSFVSITL